MAEWNGNTLKYQTPDKSSEREKGKGGQSHRNIEGFWRAKVQ
mgnify:CR=1 FL=1